MAIQLDQLLSCRTPQSLYCTDVHHKPLRRTNETVRMLNSKDSTAIFSLSILRESVCKEYPLRHANLNSVVLLLSPRKTPASLLSQIFGDATSPGFRFPLVNFSFTKHSPLLPSFLERPGFRIHTPPLPDWARCCLIGQRRWYTRNPQITALII